jgi:hypothetical protein
MSDTLSSLVKLPAQAQEQPNESPACKVGSERGIELRWHFLFPAYGSSVNDSGDENGGRLGFSPLVIRSRRRSRQPIS